MLVKIFVFFLIKFHYYDTLQTESFFPNYFHTVGTTILPYGDIEQNFEMWFDRKNKLLRIDINNGLLRTIVKSSLKYQTFYTFSDHKAVDLECWKLKVNNQDYIFSEFIPDLTKFELSGRDPLTNHSKWTYELEDLGFKNLYTFISDSSNKPISFISLGADYFSHSHPDEYKTFYSKFNKLDTINPHIFDLSSIGCTRIKDQTAIEYRSIFISPLRYEELMKKHEKHFFNNNLRRIEYTHLLGYRPSIKKRESLKLYSANAFDILPKFFDWRLYGVGSRVKDQGSCGSCWTFSVVGAIEGAIEAAIYRGKLIKFNSLSQQYLIDCSWHLNFGCNGGNPGDTLEWIVQNDIKVSSTYGSYMAINGKCHNSTETFKIKNSFKVNADVHDIKKALMKYGPLSVAIKVVESFVFYRGGIYEGLDCDGLSNHAVVLVGWGFDEITNKEYWIVRNSWSVYYGVNGFIHMSIKNDCGLKEEVYAAEV